MQMCKKITVATRCQILRLKCTIFDFGSGYAPDSARGAYSTFTGPLAGLRGPTSKGRGKGRETGKGRRREQKGTSEGSAPLSEILNTPLMHYVFIADHPQIHDTHLQIHDTYRPMAATSTFAPGGTNAHAATDLSLVVPGLWGMSFRIVLDILQSQTSNFQPLISIAA